MKKTILQKLLGVAFMLIAITHPSFSQTGIPVPEMNTLEAGFVNWLGNTTGSLGGSLALSKNGKLVYARSFGKADIGLTTDARPYNIYRIASMSKSVSSIMTMKLMQDGLISMHDKVFGPTGILNDPYYSGITIPDPATLNSITVKHLLEHTSGINTDGQSLLAMTAKFGEPNPGTIKTFVKYMMTQPLKFTPGTSIEYNSNAFVVLAAVIEKKSGMSYNDYLLSILRPLGIYDISLAKSLMMQKQEREAEYTRHPGLADRDAIDCSFYGDNSYLPAAYGGVDYELVSGAGGVMGTPKDLVKLINAVDRFTTNPKLLMSFAMDTMLQPRAIFPDYAKGWGVNSEGEFYHNGGGPGHISAWGCLRSLSGDSWGFAVIVNGSESPGQNIEEDIKNIIRNNMNTSVPNHDLFLCPGINASNISVSPVSSTSANITWTNGNGAKRLVIMRAAKKINFFPEDGTNYSANASFGSGTNLGDKNYVVYNNTGNSVTVTNLTPGLVYYVRVIEYNQNTSTGNYALYQLGENPVNHFTTVGQSDVTLTASATNGIISQSVAGSSHSIGSTVVLTALASQGYMFSGWSGSISGTQNPVEVIMDANKTVTANFVTYVPQYVLNTYPNEGRIGVSKPGFTFSEGTSLNFTAVDSSLTRSFYVWPEQSVVLNQTSTVMTENKALSAWWAFSREAESASTQSAFSPFQVVNDPTASKGAYIIVPNGTGNVSSPPSTGVVSYTYNNTGDTEVLNVWLRVKTPTTNDDNLYIKWDNGSYSTVTLPVSTSWTWVKAVNNKSLTPGTHTLYFARKEDGMAIDKMYFTGDLGYTPNIELSWHPLFTNAVNGSIALSPANEVFMDTKFCNIYRSGTTVQLTASPKPGYQFTGWSGSATGSTNPISVLVTDERNVTANFAPLAVSYTLTTNNVNGTIVRSPNAGSYASTTQVELTAIPNAGYQFTGWSGDASGLINPVTVSMVTNKTVTANFTPVSTQQYTLTTSATNGSITRSPNASTYNSGTVVQLTATPNSGYQFTGWNGAISGSTNPVNITMDANKAVTATFTASIPTTDFCFEAESASGQGTFAPYQVLNDANASGGQYIVVPNGTGNQNNPPSNSIATYTINVTEAGTYYIWMRIIANTSNDNSLLIATDGNSYNSFTPGTYTSWTWKKWSSSKSFSIGTHSISFARNEDGLQLDKIIVTKSTSTPTGTGCMGIGRIANTINEPAETSLINLAIAPNPAINETVISAILPAESYVTIGIYDSFGREVNRVVSGSLSSGHHEFGYDTSTLVSGVYLVKLTSGNESITRILIKD